MFLNVLCRTPLEISFTILGKLSWAILASSIVFVIFCQFYVNLCVYIMMMQKKSESESIHPFIHPFIHSSIHSFIHPSIHSSIYPSIHPFIHSSDSVSLCRSSESHCFNFLKTVHHDVHDLYSIQFGFTFKCCPYMVVACFLFTNSTVPVIVFLYVI